MYKKIVGGRPPSAHQKTQRSVMVRRYDGGWELTLGVLVYEEDDNPKSRARTVPASAAVLEPEQAREIARALLEAADGAEVAYRSSKSKQLTEPR